MDLRESKAKYEVIKRIVDVMRNIENDDLKDLFEKELLNIELLYTDIVGSVIGRGSTKDPGYKERLERALQISAFPRELDQILTKFRDKISPYCNEIISFSIINQIFDPCSGTVTSQELIHQYKPTGAKSAPKRTRKPKVPKKTLSNVTNIAKMYAMFAEENNPRDIVNDNDITDDTNTLVEEDAPIDNAIDTATAAAANTNAIIFPNNNPAGAISKDLAKELLTMIEKVLKPPQVVPQYMIDNDYKKCENCHNIMTILPDGSEMRCDVCSFICDLSGAGIDEGIQCHSEGHRSRTGTFNPNRHFHYWWIHILALEPEEEIGDSKDDRNKYGETLIMQLRDIIKQKKIILRTLTVADTRKMLQNIKKTHLNKNVPLIMKKLTGYGPPRPSDDIFYKVERLFNMSLEVSANCVRSDRSNRDYYPFYILKILDAILPEDDIKNRRILYYIHIQKDDTLANDDCDWERICGCLPDIKYVPTDRTKFQKYNHLYANW